MITKDQFINDKPRTIKKGLTEIIIHVISYINSMILPDLRSPTLDKTHVYATHFCHPVDRFKILIRVLGKQINKLPIAKDPEFTFCK